MGTWIRRLPLFCVALAAAWAVDPPKKPRDLHPGFNLFSKEQDIQMGREYAAQVEKQLVVVKDPAITGIIERIGSKISGVPEAKEFPFTFKVVQEKSINAFALPGGPTFTHTGLISAADNEGQIAGVLSHEISHVILRHGTNQASKANLIQLPAMLAAQMAGGGWTGTLAQLGIGLGANSVLLKFSRNAERDADLMGTRIMNKAGYNPIEMARFFEKLEAGAGKENWMTNFLSDHPNPGNRVKAVEEEIRLLPRATYMNDSGELPKVKQSIGKLPEVKKPQQQGPASSGNPGNPAAARPSSRLKDLSTREVSFQYPDNWEIHEDSQSGEVVITTPAGVIGNGIGYGMLSNILQIKQSGGDLGSYTNDLIKEFQQRDSNIRQAGQGRRFNLNGVEAMAIRLESQSPFQGTKEVDILVTAVRPKGLFYMMLIAPERELNNAQPVFDAIIQSIRFPN